MPEKTMKSNKMIILLRSFSLVCAVAVVLSCMVFSSSAVVSTVSYLDLDYDISVDGENNRITVNIPEEYFLLQIRDHANNILVSSDGSDSVELWVAQGSEYRVDCYFFKNTHFSVQDLPDGSLFYISFGTEGSSGLLNHGTFMEENWAFDKAGKEIHWYGGDLDGNRFTDTQYLYYYKPADINASSVAFGINAQECMCIKSGNFRFNVKYCTLEFSISSFLHSQLVDQQNSDLLSEVNKQLAQQGHTMEQFLEQQEQLPGQIGDEMQGVIESEKEESKSEGNKFVDQILDALPDPSTDVLAALKSLTDATAYTGTDAVLPIPAIVLPGIDGLFPETVIWEGTEFDFGDYLGFIPSSLLTLVQSLFTIAIVLFCVYELKGIISYCLTLRESKGG